ncbi:MAG TPA: carboxyl transferase domain-containing protein [Euzebyales bacterium]
MTRRVSSADVIDAVAGGFAPWDDDLRSGDPLHFHDTRGYADRLDDAAERAGTSEAVVTGRARIAGRPAVVIVGAFEFLAGTQGIVVGERVARAFDRAAAQRLPVVGLPTSGGTRMQEGSLAFVQMLKIAASVGAYRRGGGRYIAWLRHPTTGGSLASWGSLAHVTWAQPGALIGLTGPRVIETTEGAALPDHVQRAEHLAEHGVVDEVVTARALTTRLPAAIDALGPVTPGTHAPRHPWPDDPVPTPGIGPPTRADAWTAVEVSRRGDRPGLRALLAGTEDFVRLAGDGAGGRDDGCVTAICRLSGTRLVLVGHDRRPGERGAGLGAVGHRAARRAMGVAGELGLPLVTVVDTRGAAASAAAETGGVAREIGLSMMAMAALAVPTVGVLLGEGSGGSALAWLAADRVVAAEHAWLAPIAPEGASAILFRSADHAADMARQQAITASALRWAGLVDDIVPEYDGWIGTLRDRVGDHLTSLTAVPADERLQRRGERLRRLGTPA